MRGILDRAGRIALLACAAPAMVVSAVLDVFAAEDERDSLRVDLERSHGVRDELRSELANWQRAHARLISDIADLEVKVKATSVERDNEANERRVQAKEIVRLTNKLSALDETHVQVAAAHEEIRRVLGCSAGQYATDVARDLMLERDDVRADLAADRDSARVAKAAAYKHENRLRVDLEAARKTARELQGELDDARKERDHEVRLRIQESHRFVGLTRSHEQFTRWLEHTVCTLDAVYAVGWEAIVQRDAARWRANEQLERSVSLRNDLRAARDEITILRGRLT